MNMIFHAHDLPLRHPFTIARGTISTIRTLIVELRDGEHRGYGEAPANAYYNATVEGSHRALEAARPSIEAAWDEPAELWERVRPALGEHPFALCALDEAAHDLWGKRRGKPVHELWGLDTSTVPPSDYTIGLDTIERMIAKLREQPGFPVYKIKLGSGSLERDLSIVRELRRHTDAGLRVDANAGWDADQALHAARELQRLGVEFIEQPLPAGRWDDMRRVRRESALPVIADESCVAERDVERCAACFHGINIKLTKCGGLTPARRMIDHARRLGLRVMVGCMTESTVGISAVAQLLPLTDAADLDGPLLLARDLAHGVRVDRGRVIYPQTNGTGVHPFE